MNIAGPPSEENNANSAASEATSLLNEISDSVSASAEDDANSGMISTGSITSLDLEAEHPWPSTYERSISLLAGPRYDSGLVDKLTKSPKIGISALHMAQGRQHLRRGYDTPDHHLLRPPASVARAGGTFLMGIEKVKSLDFTPSKRPTTSEQNKRKMKFKAMEAKAYRQSILAKQQPGRQKEAEESLLSPGYDREKETQRERKKLQEEAPKTEGKSTVAQCCFNMANILMGVGMLGLPFVFKSAGWIGGLMVALAFGLVTWRTSILIGRELNGDPRPSSYFDDSPYKSPLVPGSDPRARMYRPIKSFPDIAREAFGEWGCFTLSLVLYFELFSCLCIFFVTLGDHMHSLYPHISITNHMIIVAFLLTIPTALLRTPKLLSYLSMVGTFATVAVVLAVLWSAISSGDISQTIAEREGIDAKPYHVLWRGKGLPLALGLIAYTFSGHAIVPSIYTSMEKPQKFDGMITFTFIVVVSLCIVVAASGYYMFGSTVQDQITLSLAIASGSDDIAMKMLTWLMILTAFSKFTLTMFPLALGIEEVFAPYVPSDRIMETTSGMIKIVLIALSLAVAIFVPSFSFLCSLVGLICTMIVSAIFPAAAHLKMFGPKLTVADKFFDWAFVIGGLFTAVVGTVATI